MPNIANEEVAMKLAIIGQSFCLCIFNASVFTPYFNIFQEC